MNTKTSYQNQLQQLIEKYLDARQDWIDAVGDINSTPLDSIETAHPATVTYWKLTDTIFLEMTKLMLLIEPNTVVRLVGQYYDNPDKNISYNKIIRNPKAIQLSDGCGGRYSYKVQRPSNPRKEAFSLGSKDFITYAQQLVC